LARTFIKIRKRRATEQQITDEIFLLLYGNGSRSYSLSVTETAKTLGVSRDTIYRYIKKMNGAQQILKNKNGKLYLPEQSHDAELRKFNKFHEITSDPLVTEWMDDLLTRRRGLPIKSWKIRLQSLETVCNTCKVNPSDLITSTKNTEKIMREFAMHFQNGTVARSKMGRKPLGMSSTIYTRVQGVRDFCAFYDITWRKGVRGIMSQKILNHGKYPDIRFTVEEFEAADKFIQARWGLDSDVYRWFWIGVESCARFNALYHMKNDWTKIKRKSGVVFLMSVIETKTEDIRGGKWTKYITRPDTQKSLQLLKERNCDRIFESKLAETPFKREITQNISEIYSHLGKKEPYFYYHPSHALRHLGAHYWLSRTDYNYGIIAEVGGWHTIDELKKSYGQIPPEKILQIIA